MSILNSQAANLPVYSGSLDGAEIKMLDDSEAELGHWSFAGTEDER